MWPVFCSLLLCAVCDVTQAKPPLHLTSDVGETRIFTESSMQLRQLKKDRLIIASHSSPYNGYNPENVLQKEHPIQLNSPLSANRIGKERKDNEWLDQINSVHVNGPSVEGSLASQRVANGLGSAERGRSGEESEEWGEKKGGSVGARTRVRRADRPHIYSLINNQLRKRHKLESDDIRQLVEALNTIRDFLESNELPNDHNKLDMQESMTTSKGDLISEMPRFALPSLLRGPAQLGPSKTHSFFRKNLPDDQKVNKSRETNPSLLHKINMQNHRYPKPPHKNDPRNLANNVYSGVPSGHVEKSEEAGVRLALRTGFSDKEENMLEKPDRYHEFNPTGW